MPDVDPAQAAKFKTGQSGCTGVISIILGVWRVPTDVGKTTLGSRLLVHACGLGPVNPIDASTWHRMFSKTKDLSAEKSPTCLVSAYDSCTDDATAGTTSCEYTIGDPSTCGDGCTYTLQDEVSVLTDAIAEDWRYACDKAHSCTLPTSPSRLHPLFW